MPPTTCLVFVTALHSSTPPLVKMNLQSSISSSPLKRLSSITKSVGHESFAMMGGFVLHMATAELGQRLIMSARNTLMSVDESMRDDRWRREMAATDGFLARITMDADAPQALSELIRVDEVLRGGDKWIYELDNLQYLIRLLPVHKRPAYQMRALIIWERIHIIEEWKLLGDDITDGNFIGGLTRTTWRTTRRHFPL